MRTSGIPRTLGSGTTGRKMVENENFWNSENSGLRHHGRKIEEN